MDQSGQPVSAEKHLLDEDELREELEARDREKEESRRELSKRANRMLLMMLLVAVPLTLGISYFIEKKHQRQAEYLRQHPQPSNSLLKPDDSAFAKQLIDYVMPAKPAAK